MTAEPTVHPAFGICPYCDGVMAFGLHLTSIVTGGLAGMLTFVLLFVAAAL